MKTTIELYVLITILTIIALLSTNYISSTMYAANAKDFHNTCINELQVSNYAPGVVANLKSAAKKLYGQDAKECLEVELLQVNGKRIGKVTLTYVYAIPFLNISKEYTISGFA